MFCICFFCCNKQKNISIKIIKTTSNQSVNKVINYDSCELEKQFVANQLINIHSLDSSIRVSLIYATSNNFLNHNIYNGLKNAYLPCNVALKLANAQYYLHQLFPYYHLIIFDATRPLSCQKKMWSELDMKPSEKINYLAHPNQLSLHNYGAAVDVGIISQNQLLVNMGTNFDSFEELSEPKRELNFYKTGKLTKQVFANRLLLRKIMFKAGFTSIASEWWHFNETNKATAAIKYKLIN